MISTTLIELDRTGEGQWIATQEGVGLSGIGPNPGRAVQHFGELVAMTTYEDGDAPLVE